MKRMLTILVCLLGLLAVPERVDAAGENDVVLRWAPVIYQQDSGRNPVARENVCTEVNFDRDWRLNNKRIIGKSEAGGAESRLCASFLWYNIDVPK